MIAKNVAQLPTLADMGDQLAKVVDIKQPKSGLLTGCLLACEATLVHALPEPLDDSPVTPPVVLVLGVQSSGLEVVGSVGAFLSVMLYRTCVASG